MDDKYQFMPPLSDEDYQRLKEDINENGVLVPIQIDEYGNCIDGHHRLQIAKELGIDYDTVTVPGCNEDQKDEMAVTLNIARRQLTPDQKVDIAVTLKERHPDWTIDKIAKLVNMRRVDLRERLDKVAQNEPSLNLSQSGIGADGKSYPQNQEQQRELIQSMMDENPDISDREISRETGASRNTVAAQRKLRVVNASNRDNEALKDPDIRERMESDRTLNVAGAIREQKRDQLVQHLESVETQEAKAVEGVYDVIVIDPPWPMERIESDARPHAVAMDYPVMDVEEIKTMDIPAADDCHIFLWTTQKYLPTAFDVLRAWGFKYVCTFVWHKDNGYKPFGLPKYNCEFCLYAHNGSPKFIDETQFWTCFDAPITGHSEKPDTFYEMICRVTAGRRLDMFNRRQIDGFDAWGNEAENE